MKKKNPTRDLFGNKRSFGVGNKRSFGVDGDDSLSRLNHSVVPGELIK